MISFNYKEANKKLLKNKREAKNMVSPNDIEN